MAIREPYKPVTDPTERLIQIRGVARQNGAIDPLVRMQVPYSIQEFFAKLLNHLGHRSDWFATCITCEFWGWTDPDCDSKHCTKFNCMPPPEVIADGCEYYEDNDAIPF